MNFKVGVDIIEIDRVKESVESERFCERVFTKNEIEYCESKKSQKAQHYAGRFAGKEAVFKAISELLPDKYEIEWKDIEVLNDKSGRPQVNILKQELKDKIKSIDISISHCKTYAVANVIAIY